MGAGAKTRREIILEGEDADELAVIDQGQR